LRNYKKLRIINRFTEKREMMKRLLIVDDELDTREFAANFFRKRKFEAITACDGPQALELFEKEKPSLILLDIRMEGMDGIEVLRRIRERDKTTPIIMVTGKEPQENEASKRCEELGILDYIHKPLELEELERVVLSVL
jgi:two-component system response regulator (stage 0 sporulation protein F)